MSTIPYKLIFRKTASGDIFTETIITDGLKSARYEGRCIAAMRGGTYFIKANRSGAMQK